MVVVGAAWVGALVRGGGRAGWLAAAARAGSRRPDGRSFVRAPHLRVGLPRRMAIRPRMGGQIRHASGQVGLVARAVCDRLTKTLDGSGCRSAESPAEAGTRRRINAESTTGAAASPIHGGAAVGSLGQRARWEPWRRPRREPRQ